MDKLERLRELDAVACVTPWKAGETIKDYVHPIKYIGTACDKPEEEGYNFSVRERDADLIATYRNETPKLIALLEQAQEALEQVTNPAKQGLAGLGNPTDWGKQQLCMSALAAIKAYREGV